MRIRGRYEALPDEAGGAGCGCLTFCFVLVRWALQKVTLQYSSACSCSRGELTVEGLDVVASRDLCAFAQERGTFVKDSFIACR